MKILRARVKPYGNPTEFVSVVGRIKSLIQNNQGEDFNFVVDDGGKKVITYGTDSQDERLEGKEVRIGDSDQFLKFEGGVVSIVEVKESNRILRFNQFDPVNESLPRKQTVDQLKRLRKLTKGVDIGDRVPNMKQQGANIHFMHNPVDTGVESYEDFEKHNLKFIPGWNVKHQTSPFKGEK